MREIKFRKYDKNNKEMDYYDLREDIISDCVYQYCQNDNCDDKCSCDLMQFTGLTDKNDKDIYEGDIVKCDTVYNKAYLKHIGTVVFELGSFIVGCDTMTDSYNTFIELCGEWDIEVIGNIHENPELVPK